MSNEHQTERSWLDDLFKDEAVGLFTSGENWESPGDEAVQAPSKAFRYPTLVPEEPAPDGQRKAYWKSLRAFFRTGKGGGLPAKDGRANCSPALLAPYLSAPGGGQYPCWIDSECPLNSQPALHTVRSLIEQNIAAFAPGETEAKSLKDNLSRLSLILEQKLSGAEIPQAPRPLFDEMLDELILQLQLKGPESDIFLDSVHQLRQLMPKQGTLIPRSPTAPFHLLAILIDLQLQQQQAELKNTIAPLAIQLRQLLDVEQEKAPEAHSASKLEEHMDFAGSFVNFEELSALMPTGGSIRMPEERLHRLEQVLQTLNTAADTVFGKKPCVVAGQKLNSRMGLPLPDLFPSANVELVSDEKALARISQRFDEQMERLAPVFAAIRIARLELDEHYQHEIHSDFFAHFTHADFNEAEWVLCPALLLVLHSEELIQLGLNDFSALLASGRPIKYLALKFRALAAAAPGTAPPVFRQEPGALAVAHRDTYVLQTSITDPLRLLDGFWQGLINPAPAFFYVLSYTAERPGLVWTSGAMGGREFPSFTFDSRKGPKWGSRFDISNNPHPELDWPEEMLLFADENGATQRQPSPFTFADFAALDPDCLRFFNLVPAACWSDELVPIANYLQLTTAEAYSKVPFIWMVDAENRLQKAAVALPLVQICLERLDFWHFLQENAGVHSYHVEQATELLRRDFDAQMEQRINELQEAHTRELEQAREDSTRSAMERLADFLLDAEITELVPTPARPTEKTAPAAAVVSEPKPPPPPAVSTTQTPAPEPEISVLGEAWIETPLCTTCNECTNLNDRIFKYNSEKQAYIANPAGGPFADIVSAAESCPVAIIHPGAPLNPDEPNLDALVKRAAKFN